MNLFKWWMELPFVNEKLDELASPDSLRRKRPLTLKEVFFRGLCCVSGWFGILSFMP